MTYSDQFMLALTAWRENRGGGQSGMQSVINLICNRAKANGTTPYHECTRPWQFSSITAENDPELMLWPQQEDPQFSLAQTMAALAAADSLQDITGGATSCYALSVELLRAGPYR
jgi:hypothetical protein